MVLALSRVRFLRQTMLTCYEHAAEWAECLDWEVTPVLTDEQAGPLIAKAYS